jgi:transposase-like protein
MVYNLNMPSGIYDRTQSKPHKPFKFFHDKVWLEKQYLELEKTTVIIGKELGMSANSINRWLKKYQIPVRDSRSATRMARMALMSADKLTKYKISKEYLVENYKGKRKTLNQIAREFGCSWDVVRKRVIKYGLGFNRLADKKSIRLDDRKQGRRRFQKILLLHYNHRCAICGYDKFVNACHIKPRANGGLETIENGIVLCPNHHSEFDYGVLSESEVKRFQINKT